MIDDHLEDQIRKEEEGKNEEPSDPISSLTIYSNDVTGEITMTLSESLNRMQVRALLSGALALLDADIIAESMAMKMQELAAKRSKIIAPR
jgi:hypothetical protein